MSSYKKYMDRIKLDDEQHKKLLEAVRAAEADQAAGGLKNDQPEKLRRFPLKRLALIASAAAVIVLAVGVFPGRQKSMEASYTSAAAAWTEEKADSAFNDGRIETPNTLAPEAYPGVTKAAETIAEQTRASFQENESKAPADTQAAPSAQATAVTSAPPAEQAPPATQAPSATQAATAAPTDTKNGTEAQEENSETPAEDSLFIRKTNDESGETVIYTVTCCSDGGTDDGQDPCELYSLLMELKVRLEDATEPTALIDPAADYRFGLNGEEFSYDSEEGLIWADEAEYALNESEHAALNELLDELLTTE